MMKKVMELLPIGSVVRLTAAKKDLMITGIRQGKKGSDREFDYIGVLWPEGSMGPNTNVLFDHADIQSVVFMGYDTPERTAFLEKLDMFYETKR